MILPFFLSLGKKYQDLYVAVLGLGYPLNIKVWMPSGQWVCGLGLGRNMRGHPCTDDHQVLWLLAPDSDRHPGITSSGLWPPLCGSSCLEGSACTLLQCRRLLVP